MSQTWAFQDAKAKLSEVVKKALNEGPQSISVRGEPAVVVLSQKDYLVLTSPPVSIVDFFRKSPLAKVKLDITRDKSLPREIDL